MAAVLPERFEVIEIVFALAADPLVDVEENELILIGVISADDALLAFKAPADPYPGSDKQDRHRATSHPTVEAHRNLPRQDLAPQLVKTYRRTRLRVKLVAPQDIFRLPPCPRSDSVPAEPSTAHVD
jgi:hypothetical protein